MAVNPGVWGIDIGQCALKAIRLEQINGVLTATAFDYVEHPKILSQPDANPDELTKEALEKFLSRNPVKGDLVAMSVPGQSGLARFVKLPPVEEKKILDIVKFEAKQQIPFPLEEVVWDYQKVSEGVVTDGFAMDTEIGLFAMKRDMINRFIGHFLGVKIEVHYVQMAPLALANYVTFDLLKKGGIDGSTEAAAPGKKKCVVCLDVGTDGSNLIITDGARIIWQRPIPVGGNNFTRVLTKELKLTFAKAEHLKRNAAKSPELANILKALRPVLTEFVSEVQRSLGYFTNTHRDAQVEYMVGLGSAFRLPGLQKFLADKLSLDVRKPAKFERLSGESVTSAPVFTENLLSFPVAYGLALQGLGTARISTNLLPPEITFDRKIRAKKPYSVAAAASMLLGTAVLAYGYSVPLADVNDARIKTALDKAKGVVGQAQSLDKQINDKKTEIKNTQTEVESIIAGQTERPNWRDVFGFVTNSLPVPGPNGNLVDPQVRMLSTNGADLGIEVASLWNQQKGIEAIRKFEQRLKKGVDPLAPPEEEDYREHLAMIDIEAIYSRYTDNLKGTYENLERKHREDFGGRRSFPGSEIYPDDWWTKKDGTPHPPAEDVAEELKPDGAGWVFEVRGYTYYKPDKDFQTSAFIRNTLVRNLIARSRGKVVPKDGTATPDPDPIAGKISHVFLYNVWDDKTPSGSTFKQIGVSLIDSKIPAPGAATGGATPPPGGELGGSSMGAPGGMLGLGGAPGAAAPGGWTPVNSTGSGQGTGGPGLGMPGMPGMPGLGSLGVPGMSGPPGMPGMPGAPGMPGMPGAPGGSFPGAPGGESGPPATTSTTGSKLKVKPRYEFVVVFVWKEPTPSDSLRTVEKIDPSAAAAPGGGLPGGLESGGRGGGR